MGEQFNFRLDPELKKAFIDKARADGTTATEFLTAFVKNYLGIDNSPPIQLDSNLRVNKTYDRRNDGIKFIV